MKTFDVYEHPTRGFEAVKRGFSWPAFLFGWIWAFVKGLWWLGFGILGLLGMFAFVEGPLRQNGMLGGILLIDLLWFAFAILLGAKGNDWRREDLKLRGSSRIATVEAENPDAAIAAAMNLST